MATINSNFLKLQKSYLFSTIAQKVSAFKANNPDAQLIRLGIGDVTRPLAPAVIEALHKAVDEQASADTFRGYGPEQGYEFLRQAIIDGDFTPRGINIDLDEVFINDGAKSDTGNFVDILGTDNTICVTDPIYPVYIDTNVMAGRAGNFEEGAWDRIAYSPCNAENNFIPALPTTPVDLIYLCYPNNPTGTTLSRTELKRWVDYALANDAIILYDAAYEAYIQDEETPHSIYEIEGARACAVEFHSFSKTAGFTGLRCGYTIVPKEVTAKAKDGSRVSLNPLWNRRQCTKFNGTPYIVQRAAEAIYSEAGKRQVRETIDYYMTNARLMREALTATGLQVFGGENAPYIWFKTPAGVSSWEFFESLLHEAHIVSTPGAGFGPAGEGYIRLTAFGRREDCEEAMRRLKTWMQQS
ncbi:MAG: LL-diaminopimelate aminotransferase [Alloprevotella sp.]|nr:LL-diaminopimelate aminotransferase [Bacteroidales bacterium]MDY3943298.1 LL-diaminopimelate aminotransferase [Alloprevotella sp.]